MVYFVFMHVLFLNTLFMLTYMINDRNISLCWFYNIALHLLLQDSNVVHMKAKVGCHLFWLFCTNESTNETTVWRKNGNLMPSKQVYFKQTSYYPLLCVHKSDEGNYTCHNTSKAGELHLGKIVLKVLGKTFPLLSVLNKSQ